LNGLRAGRQGTEGVDNPESGSLEKLTVMSIATEAVDYGTTVGHIQHDDPHGVTVAGSAVRREVSGAEGSPLVTIDRSR
jgi:hypothetical protein